VTTKEEIGRRAIDRVTKRIVGDGVPVEKARAIATEYQIRHEQGRGATPNPLARRKKN